MDYICGVKLNKMKEIVQFIGDYSFLSNFHPCEVILEGYEYPTVEHAYVAAKTTDTNIRESIRRAIYPGQAKRMGKHIVLREDWELIKLDVMKYLLRQKFKPGTDLAQKLFDTGDVFICEGNTWGDMFWGKCKGKGKNNLGRMIMEVREELKVIMSEEN
jgi:ribA/ribD-fused uncharacterized protein